MQCDLFTTDDLEEAVNDFSMVKYFPNAARGAIMHELAKMVPNRTALRWLANEVKAHISEWPGMSEIRGLLCTRFDPADGIDHWCSLPGYRAEDAEAKHFEEHKRLKDGSYQHDDSQSLVLMYGDFGKMPDGKVQ